MSREYRTIKSPKHVGSVSREEIATAIRSLSEGKPGSRSGKSDTGRFAAKTLAGSDLAQRRRSK